MRAAVVAGAADRPPLPATDFAALLPDVARRLRGEPERIEAGGATWRYGSHGSLAVHVGGAWLAARGTWPANGPPLPAAVRWLPPGAWEHLPDVARP